MDKTQLKQGLRKIILAIPGGRRVLRARALSIARRGDTFMGDAKKAFLSHYETNEWGSEESVSGPGSTLESTENIRKHIPRLVEDLGVKVILDAPCGDYNWFGEISWNAPVAYIGGDIVEPLVELNRSRYGTDATTFIRLDIIKDPLPSADLWLCRDCFLHLSERDVFLTLANFLKSEIPYILTSTYPERDVNTDLPTGSGGRQINLQLPPYNLGSPSLMLEDWVEGSPVQHLALWGREAIRDSLASNRAFLRATHSCR